MTERQDDTRVTPSTPDTAWLFERGEGNMPPGEGAAFANGYRHGREEAAAEIERGRKELDISWAAGLFEGEGAICCAQKYKAATNKNGERRKSGFRWWLVMHSTDHDVLRKFYTVIGRGKVYGPYQDKRSANYKPQLRWATTTLEDTQAVLKLFYPYLGERRCEKALQCLEAVYVREPSNRAA